MGNFDRDSRPSNRGGGRGGFGGGRSSFGGNRGGFQSRGRSSFGGGRSFGNDRGGDRQMFKATCDNCGKECEVPFKPTSGKPVYCSDCFEKMGGRDGRDERNDRPRPEFRAASQNFDSNKAQFDALNAKMDKILSLLEPKAKETKKEVFVAPIVEEMKEEVKLPKVKKVKKVTSEVVEK